jgi:hypothetical protein
MVLYAGRRRLFAMRLMILFRWIDWRRSNWSIGRSLKLCHTVRRGYGLSLEFVSLVAHRAVERVESLGKNGMC